MGKRKVRQPYETIGGKQASPQNSLPPSDPAPATIAFDLPVAEPLPAVRDEPDKLRRISRARFEGTATQGAVSD